MSVKAVSGEGVVGPAGAWSELSHGGNAHGVRSSEWLPVGVINGGSGVHNRRRVGYGQGQRPAAADAAQVTLSRFAIFFFNWDVYSCWNLIVVVVNRIIRNVGCLD